MTIKATEP